MKLATLAIAAGVLAAGAITASAQPKAQPKQLTAVEGITEYVLANGMHVLMFPDSSKETVTVNVTYMVGSRMEGYGETGMAHLLEHMMFKGSPKHPKVWEELQNRGAANNASTWYDRTNYFETLPAKGDNLAWALEMEADRMLNSNISQQDLNSEFSVVRNEFEKDETDPKEVLSERMWSTAYLWHNYGKSTIGSRSDIEKVPATSLKRFYKKYYRPDNAVLLVTGKFDANEALKLVNEKFAGLANPTTPIEPTYTTEPVQDGERLVTLRRVGDVQVVGLTYHVTATADPEYSSVEAIGHILADEPSGRLYTALVKTGMATSVTAGMLVLHDPAVLEIQAIIPATKSADAVRDKMIQIVEGMGKSKITDEELARFKAKSKKQFKLLFANSGSLAIRISEYIGAGDWRLFFIDRDRIAALKADEVQAVAGKYLMSSNRTLGLFIPVTKGTPERAPLKETPDIAKVVSGYKGQPPEADGEKFEATLENIEKRTKRSTLPSGMKLAILDKTTRGHVVRARLTLRFGTEADFTGKRPAISMLDAALERGTKQHTYQQLKDQWDTLEAQVGFSSSPGILDVNIQTTHDNFPMVLALVDEVLRQPAYPQDQFDIAIKEAVSQLEEQKSEPQVQGFQNLTRMLSPYAKTHPLYTPTTEEQINELKALKLAEVKPFASMLGTSNATMTIIGDFDVKGTQAWIEKTWGNWKSPKPFKRIERKFTATAAAEQTFDFADKTNAVIGAGHAIDMKDDDAEAPAMTAANYTFGGGGFVSRVMTRLRQKDGLSYGAGSGVNLPPLDAAGFFIAGGIVAPENAKKAMAALTEELDRFVTKGVTAEELADAKKGILQGFERNLSNDAAVMGMLSDGLYLGRTMDFWIKRNAAINALTLDQVNGVIKKRFKNTAVVKIIAGDKKKMESGAATTPATKK